MRTASRVMDYPSSGCTVHLLSFSHSVMSSSLQPRGLQHSSLPCPSLSSRVFSNACVLSQRCHPTISSSVIHLSSLLQSFSASGSFPMSPSTENWIKDLLSMAPPIRTRPTSHSLPSGSFHKPLIRHHQRADRMKTIITEN